MQEEKQSTISKRKLINKVHKKNKRRMERLAQTYESKAGTGSGIGQFMSEGKPEMDFDMANLISTGHNRKMKKKMKKLQKKFSGAGSEDKIFK